MSIESLINRAFGQYAVSVATSLALESLTNTHEEIQHKSDPVYDYQEFWFNLKTLFRNIVGASGVEAKNIPVGKLAGALVDEMKIITSILSEHRVQEKNIIFYVSNHKNIETKFPKATIRADSTDKQKSYTKTLSLIISSVIKHLENDPVWKGRIRVFDLELRPEKPVYKTIIMTHQPVDLLSYTNFLDLVLLESHTGAIKRKTEWYTKYLNWKELPKLPWNKGLLQILGDKETFRPMDIKVKRALVDAAIADHWTVLTTRDKIRASIDKFKNPYAKAIVLSLV